MSWETKTICDQEIKNPHVHIIITFFISGEYLFTGPSHHYLLVNNNAPESLFTSDEGIFGGVIIYGDTGANLSFYGIF